MKKPWFYILLSLAEAPRHGSAIQEDVRELSGGSVRLWPVTLYGSIEALVDAGWIAETQLSEPPDGANGRERFYGILPDGREALRAEVRGMEATIHLAHGRLTDGVG